ncbi:MAG: vitamin K epoxide reductase family protein [Sediminibacterium sp.]
MSLLFSHYTNATPITIHLIKRLGVLITKTSIKERLENHPYFPSLLSINDVLTNFKISSYPILADKAKLIEMPLPFLAHLKNGEIESFAVVYNIDDGMVKYYDARGSKKNKAVSIDEFQELWSGNSILVETSQDSGQNSFYKYRIKEIIEISQGPILLIFCCSIFSLYYYDISYPLVVVNIFSVLGIFVSIELFKSEIGNDNRGMLSKLCSLKKNTNCSAVLNSKYSNFYGVPWSLIGVTYFTINFLLILLSQANAFSLVYLNCMLAMPYTLFSVYYQWKVIKRWCVLCLIVQFILASQFIFLLTLTNINQPVGELIDIFIRPENIFSFLAPIALLWFIYPRQIQIKKLKRDERELKRLKDNKNVFDAVLSSQNKVKKQTENLGIHLGNAFSKFKIIKVCNPFCNPCGEAHLLLHELMKEKDVSIQLIFQVSPQDEERADVVRHFLVLQKNYGQDVLEDALNFWYTLDNKNISALAEEFPVTNNICNDFNEELEKMFDWCVTQDIQYTPTIFINGFQYPEMYKLNEVKNFIR